jgi:histidyl-tRNA synthetase
MSAIVLGGNKKFSPGDLVAIAVHEQEVSLDQAALDKMAADKKLKPPTTEDLAAALGESNSKSSELVMPSAQLRAVMATRIVSLMTARLGMRPAIPEFLAAVLNAGICPSVSDAACLEDLSEYLSCSPERAGELVCSVSGSADAKRTAAQTTWGDALREAQLEVPGLSGLEKKNFTHGLAVDAAFLGLVVDTCEGLVAQADVVAALSCEVAAVWDRTFESDNYDVCRPHRYSTFVASNMRLLLAGSTVLTKKSSKRSADCFTYIPNEHAPLRSALGHVLPAVKVELNAAEAGSCGTSTRDALTFHPEPIVSCVTSLLSAVQQATSASQDRVAALCSSVAECKGMNEDVEGLQDLSREMQLLPTTLYKYTQNLAARLAHEAFVCFQVLVVMDEKALEAAKATAAKKAAKAAKREADMKAKFDAAVAEGKTPKPLKVAKVKPAKEPTGIMLGMGTRKVLNWLSASAVDSQSSMRQLCASKAGRALFFDVLTPKDTVSKPTVAKGVRDATPEQMAIREKCFAIIKDVFQRHGGVAIDTPVFELKSTLMGKYGEDTKLIYELADQGGQQLALRYDLTVPFARFVACNGIKNIKRYHIAKVYRRDQPQMTKGRYREFHQCDFDICGDYPSMIPDAEILKVLCDVLSELNLGGFKVKLSHRLLLDALMAVSGVPDDLFRPICSAVDKLDKLPWEAVRKEMVHEKGLPGDVADVLGAYVTRDVQGMTNIEILDSLRSDAKLCANTSAVQAFAELEKVFGFLECFGVDNQVKFDLSLARGLDYYTGLIYEAVLTDTDQVGSIAAGGRYDGLIGMFSGSKIPAVGMSVGIERILSVLEGLERKRAGGSIRKNYTQVFVGSVGKQLLKDRMQICNELWTHKIKTEFMYHENPKANRQLTYCLENEIPIILWIGEDEVKNNTVTVKDLRTRSVCVLGRADLPTKVQELLALSTEDIAQQKAANADVKADEGQEAPASSSS